VCSNLANTIAVSDGGQLWVQGVSSSNAVPTQVAWSFTHTAP
jgi:hypothetical protein